jgi:hypothetical protein
MRWTFLTDRYIGYLSDDHPVSFMQDGSKGSDWPWMIDKVSHAKLSLGKHTQSPPFLLLQGGGPNQPLVTLDAGDIVVMSHEALGSANQKRLGAGVNPTTYVDVSALATSIKVEGPGGPHVTQAVPCGSV